MRYRFEARISPEYYFIINFLPRGKFYYRLLPVSVNHYEYLQGNNQFLTSELLKKIP
jgi:hypothetical protein